MIKTDLDWLVEETSVVVGVVWKSKLFWKISRVKRHEVALSDTLDASAGRNIEIVVFMATDTKVPRTVSEMC